MFIPYLGSKFKFADFIISNFPKNFGTYVEPFGGAFSIFFELEYNINTKYIYNDVNIYNYLLLKFLNDVQFLNSLKKLEVNRDVFKVIQRDFKNNNWSDFDKATNWLILLLCTQTQFDILSSDYKGNFNFEAFKLKLPHYQEKMKKISSYHNIDYLEIIDVYDSPDTFFYLDPPYKNLESYYLNHNFGENSHYELSQKLNSIQGKFVLSYYYFPEMEEWYKDCRMIKKRTLMGTEYLIMNYQ
jgi:DNA adenine methylase